MRLKLTDPSGKVLLAVARMLAREVDGETALREMGFTSPDEIEAAKVALAEIEKLPPEKRRAALDDLRSQLEAGHIKSKAVDAARGWLKTRPIELQRPTGSAWHKLSADFEVRDLIVLPASLEWDTHVTPFFASPPQVFLIEHDWGAAFSGAADYADGEYRLPFESCCFEMRLSGRRLMAVESEQGRLIAIQAERFWVVYPPVHLRGEAEDDEQEHLRALSKLVETQVRAVCVALEAEVAMADVVRAPYKLNAARERKGQPPIADYHVVSLTRRQRATPLPSGREPEHGKVRLHFRRGHWRHYENHKTWIKWNLVGNPDLGFINKHYRL